MPQGGCAHGVGESDRLESPVTSVADDGAATSGHAGHTHGHDGHATQRHTTRLRDDGDLEVVAMGTGCKCLGADAIPPDGTLLADSHAEIVCRRAFVAYLHAQLKMLGEQGESTVFAFNTPAGEAGGGGACVDTSSQQTASQPAQSIVLKRNMSFHFYVSQAPCGDACIFDVVVDGEEDDEAHQDVGGADSVGPAVVTATAAECDGVAESAGIAVDSGSSGAKRRRVEDIHRTGAKPAPMGGSDPLAPGKGYHTRGLLRTKPGRGPPTRSMSCTDKMCRWFVIGCQGALLARLIPPVYFQSVVVAELADVDALHRALAARIPTVDGLPLGYSVHLPEIITVAARFPHGRGAAEHSQATASDAKLVQSVGVSVGWAMTALNSDEKHLVDVTNRGRKQGVPKKRQLVSLALCSKLSKVALWKSFNSACTALRCRLGEDAMPSTYTVVLQNYWNAKQLSLDYQRAKAALLRARPFDGWVGNGDATQLFWFLSV